MAEYLDKAGVGHMWDKIKAKILLGINAELDATVNKSAKEAAETAAKNAATLNVSASSTSKTYSIRSSSSSVDNTVTFNITNPNGASLSVTSGKGSISGNTVSVSKGDTTVVKASKDVSYNYSYNAQVASYKDDGDIKIDSNASKTGSGSKYIDKSMTFSYKSKDNASTYYLVFSATPLSVNETTFNVNERNGSVSISLGGKSAIAWDGNTSGNKEATSVGADSGNFYIYLIAKSTSGSDPSKGLSYIQGGDWKVSSMTDFASYADTAVANGAANSLYPNYKWWVRRTTGNFGGKVTLKVK